LRKGGEGLFIINFDKSKFIEKAYCSRRERLPYPAPTNGRFLCYNIIMKKKYYYISAVFALLIGLTIFGFNYLQCQGSECGIDNQEVQKKENVIEDKVSMINQAVLSGEAILLDVRENSEWEEGRIEGAQLLPLGSINKENTKQLDKNKPVYVYCRSGRRAGEAVIKLKDLGFNQVLNLGGIVEWQKNGGDLIK